MRPVGVASVKGAAALTLSQALLQAPPSIDSLQPLASTTSVKSAAVNWLPESLLTISSVP